MWISFAQFVLISIKWVFFRFSIRRTAFFSRSIQPIYMQIDELTCMFRSHHCENAMYRVYRANGLVQTNNRIYFFFHFYSFVVVVIVVDASFISLKLTLGLNPVLFSVSYLKKKKPQARQINTARANETLDWIFMHKA